MTHATVLQAEGLSAWYGAARVLYDVQLTLAAGEVLALLGRNGAGKTALLKALMGLMPRATGRVTLGPHELARLPAFRRARLGLGYVPEDRRIFTDLTVAENLAIAARPQPGGFDRAALLAIFPNLAEMLDRPAGAMSGGEQQMLAVARTLASNPQVVLLDEPSEGIAPLVVVRMREALQAMRARGVTVLLAEQNLAFAAAVADRALLIETGHVSGAATRAELQGPSAAVRQALGV